MTLPPPAVWNAKAVAKKKENVIVPKGVAGEAERSVRVVDARRLLLR